MYHEGVSEFIWACASWPDAQGTPEALAEKRKIAIVVAFVAAAILTPPDVISQLLLALPIIMLYELSIFGARMLVPPYENEFDDT